MLYVYIENIDNIKNIEKIGYFRGSYGQAVKLTVNETVYFILW